MRFTKLTPWLLGMIAAVACVTSKPKYTADPSLTPTLGIQHVAPADAAKLIQDKKVTVLDIRTPAEFEAGHIAGATNLDFHATDFARKLDQFDKEKTYLLHCASGRRSTTSLATFAKLKFQSVIHLDGGLKAWEKAGKPVEKSRTGLAAPD